MSRFVHELYHDDEQRYYWLDTVTCPIEPISAKQQALEQMRATYTEADKVLVLDSWLMSQSLSKMCDFEIVIRMSLSMWTRRLWTLQEGMLASDLYFQFQDGSIAFDDIWPHVVDERGCGMAEGMRDFQMRIRGQKFAYIDPRVRPNDWNAHYTDKDFVSFAHLGNPADALNGRQCTVPTDEPLILANLMGTDASAVVEGDVSGRMKRFWASLNECPTEILFTGGERLGDPGYRWAPRSLIRGYNRSLIIGHTPAVRSDKGLIVKLSGIVLGWRGHDIPNNFWVRDTELKWAYWCYTNDWSDTMSLSSKEDLNLVLLIKPPEGNSLDGPFGRNAVLVAAREKTADAIHSIYLGTLQVAKEPPHHQRNKAKQAKSRFEKEMKRSHSGTSRRYWPFNNSGEAKGKLAETNAAYVVVDGKQLVFDGQELKEPLTWCID